MQVTSQNEYGIIKELYIKNIKDGFVNQSLIDENWEDLSYLFRPDFEEAQLEYGDFRSILESYSSNIHSFPADATTGIDSIYCRDASIVTDHGVILCNMGKNGRIAEPDAQARFYHARGETVLGRIQSPGLLEGGDAAWIDQNTVAVGKGYRSNADGVSQLKNLVSSYGVKVISYDLPHHHGPGDVFHLMSIFSPVDRDLAVVFSPLMPVAFRQMLLEKGYQLVEVPEKEFISMGCNVLALAPRKCLMVKGNPMTEKRLKDAGCEVITYRGKHISVAGGGGPTCLTRPIKRLVE